MIKKAFYCHIERSEISREILKNQGGLTNGLKVSANYTSNDLLESLQKISPRSK